MKVLNDAEALSLKPLPHYHYIAGFKPKLFVRREPYPPPRPKFRLSVGPPIIVSIEPLLQQMHHFHCTSGAGAENQYAYLRDNKYVLANGKILMKYDRALLIAQKKGRPTQAEYKLLVEADQEGDFRATHALGTWYLFGTLFTKKNEKKAVQMFRVAAQNNVADAAYHLGVAYERGVGIRKSLKSAFVSYVHAALLGDAQAHFSVGKMYFHGLGTPRNRTLAKYWLDRAEVLGVVEDC